MAKNIPVTVGGERYPSQEWADAVRQLKAQGKAETTSAIQKIMGGEGIAKTLPPEEITETKQLGVTQTVAPQLPAETVDDLTAMRILMRNISQGAYATGIGKGLTTVTGELEEQGLGTAGMSGDITSRIISFVEGQVRRPVEQQFQTMADVMSGIERRQVADRQSSLTNLNLLIENDALGFMKDSELKDWAAATGVSVETLKALKQTTTANTAAIDAYAKAVETGQMTMANVPADAKDKVIQKVDFTKVPPETFAPPMSYKEWQYAGGQQGTGKSYAEWLRQGGDEILAAPGQIVNKVTGEPMTLPATTMKRISGFNTFVSEGDSMLARINELLSDPEVNTGGIEKKAQELAYRRGGGLLGAGGLNEKEQELSNLMSMLNNEYLYSRSGAQINEEEQKRLKDAQPEWGYDNTINKQKAKDFIGVVKNMMQSDLDVYGATIAGAQQTEIPTGGMSEDEEYQEYLLQDTIKNILSGELEAAIK